VLLDLNLPSRDWLGLLRRLREGHPLIPVISVN
jgi:CheY-like chemotaxis protein